MSRCIVLIRSHEPLLEGWRKRSFSPAGPLLDSRVKVPGLTFDETYHPVQVLRRIGGGDDPPSASGFNYAAVGPAATYAVRVTLDDEAAVERLRRDRHPEIVGVFADPAVSPFPSAYCGDAAIGATKDVARGLGVPALSRAGLTGSGVTSPSSTRGSTARAFRSPAAGRRPPATCRARARRTTAPWWRTTSGSRPPTRASSTTRSSSPRRGPGPRFSRTASPRSRTSWSA